MSESNYSLPPPPGPLVWEIQGYHWDEAAKYLESHPDKMSIPASHNRDKWSFLMVRGDKSGEYQEQIFYDDELLVSRLHIVKQKCD